MEFNSATNDPIALPAVLTIKFSDSFWDDKLSGWDVLYKNFRSSLVSVKEFEQYLRECANTEDVHVKNLDKIKLQIQKFSNESSLAPVWHHIFKDLNQSNSAAHLHFKYRVEELIKELQNYYDDLRKKKHKLKESELKTQQLIELMRQVTVNLAKSKELYYQANAELDKQTLDTQNSQQNGGSPTLAAQLTLQKIEKKFQLLKDDHVTAIEKYNSTRVEYEQRYVESCNLFQAEEETHLKRMRSFILNYTQLVAQLNSSRQKHFSDCQQNLANVYTNEMLMQQLVMVKGTGTERPPEAQLVEPSFTDNFSRFSFSSQIQRMPTTTSAPFDSNDSSQNEFNDSKNETTINDNDETIINYSSSMPATTTSASNTPKQFIKFNTNMSGTKTVELRKKIDGRGFNLLDMFSRSNKSTNKPDLNAQTGTPTGSSQTPVKKPSNKLNDSLGKSSGLSSSYSFLPSFLVYQNHRNSGSGGGAGGEEKIATTPESSSGDVQLVIPPSHQTVVDAVSDAFDKQLKQIDNLEHEFSREKKKASRLNPPTTNGHQQITSNPVNINFNLNSNKNQYQRKKVTRIIDDNKKQHKITFDLNKDSSSVTSNPAATTSPMNIVRVNNGKSTKEDKQPPVGSMITATSLMDENNSFVNSSFFENVSDYLDTLKVASSSEHLSGNKKLPLTKSQDAQPKNQSAAGINDNFYKQSSIQYAFSESSDDDDDDDESKSHKTSKYENVSSTNELSRVNSDDSNDSDDSDDSDMSKQMFVVIKPLEKANQAASPEVLRQTGKCLTLNNKSANMQALAKKKRLTIISTATNNNNNESLTSISSINNILPSSSPSLSSDRDVSRSLSALSMHPPVVNSILHESNQENDPVITFSSPKPVPERQQLQHQHQPTDENNNLNMFQMDKATNMEVETINTAPPLPPLPLQIKLKYQDLLYSQYNLSLSKTHPTKNGAHTNYKSKSETGSFENLSFDGLSDLSANNSPVNVKNINKSNNNISSIRLTLPGETFSKF